jgi:RNA polymerase sigma factor (sigma-70 family)
MTARTVCLTAMPAESPQAAGDSAARLSARLVAGEEAAWTEFHAQTFDRLLRYLLAAAHGNEDAAREALQAAYVKCVRHVRRFETEEAMWGWLAQIARGCLIDLARRRARYAAVLERLAEEPASGDSAPIAQGDLLAASVAQLAPAERTLLEARYTAGQPIAEIAAALGTTPKAVESRLARLRTRLRALLTRTLRHEP